MVASPLWHAVGPDGAPVGLEPDDRASPVPPLLGQHTAAVLQGDLGMDADEVAALAEAGVVKLGS